MTTPSSTVSDAEVLMDVDGVGIPGIIGNTGADRSSAWIWDFSSTQSTSAFSGGSRYSPTTSRTLSMKCGSVLILKVSTRCGLSPHAFQIRPTVDFDSPDSLAIDARDQCVASSGWRSSVATTTASICSSPIMRGAPGRGSSASPSKRSATNRPRHLHDHLLRHPTRWRLPYWICLPHSPTRSDTAGPAPAPTSAAAPTAAACHAPRRSTPPPSPACPVSPPTNLYNYSANFWRRTLAGPW